MTSFDASLAARSRPRRACEKAAAAPRVPKTPSGEAAGASSLRLRAEVCVRVRSGHTSLGPGRNERSNPGGGAWHGTCGRTRGVLRDGRRHRTPSSTPRGAGRRARAPRRAIQQGVLRRDVLEAFAFAWRARGSAGGRALANKCQVHSCDAVYTGAFQPYARVPF